MKIDTHCVSQWHHERNINVLKDNKEFDLREIWKNPIDYIKTYWEPVAPYIKRLLNVVYPGIVNVEMDSTQLTSKAFRAVLVEAHDYCAMLSETAPNYAMFESVSGQKCSRPSQHYFLHSLR